MVVGQWLPSIGESFSLVYLVRCDNNILCQSSWFPPLGAFVMTVFSWLLNCKGRFPVHGRMHFYLGNVPNRARIG